MGDAFSVPFIFSWCQRVNKLSQLNKKRHSGHVHTNPDKLMYCILHICVNTNSVWCIRFGLSIHTNTPHVFESFSPVQTKTHTIFYETCIMLVVYMIYDIIVFENLRFGPSTRKWEAGVFKNLHSEERFWKAAFWGTVCTRYVWTRPKQGILSLLFKCLIIVVKIAKLVSTLAIRLAIRESKVATEHCCPPKWKFSFKGAFQKSELAGGTWPNQSFWPWNSLFPRVFAKKSSPPYIPCRIWQIWLDGLNQFNDFLNQQGNLTCHQSGNRKYHSTETPSLLVTGHIFKAMDKKEITAMVLIDLSKASNSICHRTLLLKLQGLGV